MKAPASAIKPPNVHAARINVVDGTCCATTYGLMKIPEPMIPPMTIIVVSNKPSRRARCASEDLLLVTRSRRRIRRSGVIVSLSDDHRDHNGCTEDADDKAERKQCRNLKHVAEKHFRPHECEHDRKSAFEINESRDHFRNQEVKRTQAENRADVRSVNDERV